MVQSVHHMSRRNPGRRTRWGLLAFVCLLAPGVLAACGGAELAPPVVQASVLVNQDKVPTRQLEVPVMLADNTHAGRVFLSMADVITGQCRFYVSDDNGYTWRKSAAPSLAPYTDCGPGKSQPLNWRTTMAQGSDGTLYV